MMSLYHLARDSYRHLPNGLRRAVLVRRRQPIWRRSGIIFVHIPKAAGTSFSLALYGRQMGHVTALDVKRWASADVARLPSFAVSRNPWDRLVSAYRFAVRGHGLGAEQAGVWKPQQYDIPQFESFATFVTEWLATRDVTKLDGIFQPQSHFLCDARGRLLVDHVGRLGDLAPTLDFVERHLGRKLTLQRLNRSGEATDYRSFYTPELVELVGRIYAADIRAFGFEYDTSS